jgi:histidinol-phosphatase (PHP family)
LSADRRASDLPLDAHVHTDLSPDSDVPIDDYARQAVQRNIAEIAITDHVDFDPSAPAYAFSTFAQRERTVRDAAERWGPRGVAIRFGVEVTWDRRWEADIRDHLARNAYDFVIGSVHVYRDSVYSAEHVGPWVAAQRRLGDVVAPYFDEVTAGARTGLFDAMGHIDFVKRYLVPHVTPDQLAAAPELYEPILLALVASGTALEVNTSGLRQDAAESYPSAAIVARFHELGGERITVGSDAHRAEHFGWALDDGYAAARAAGFREITFRRGGETPAVVELSRPA